MINKYSWEVKEGEIPRPGVIECKTCHKQFIYLKPLDKFPNKCPNCGKIFKEIEHFYIGKIEYD